VKIRKKTAQVKRAILSGSASLPSLRHGTGFLTDKGLSRVDAFRIVQRRARAAGLEGRVCNHSLCATWITAHLENGGKRRNQRFGIVPIKTLTSNLLRLRPSAIATILTTKGLTPHTQPAPAE